MNYKRYALIALLILASLSLIFGGCDKSLKGNLINPVPPTIAWANVGSDSLNHVNPVLFWYTRDQDGVVLDRLYTVMLSTTVDSLGGIDAVMNNFPSDAAWTTVHTDSATIPLIASPDTSVYISQYIFIKAMDDDSLFSNTIYKVKSRNNHRPTCYVIVPTVKVGSREVPDPQWCLPETTSTFKGIRVAWIGKDSIDIPGIQPDFDWNVRVYGPFADSLSCDTLPNHLYKEYTDPLDSTDVWIRDKEKFLTNLETGWYMLYARNRDDAYTPSIPAVGKLSVYEPTWIRHPELTKQILLANHSYYAIDDLRRGTAGELKIAYSDSVRTFYSHLIETYLTENGFAANDYDWVNFTTIGPYSEQSVSKASLYNHKLVIILDTDWTKALVESPTIKQESPYAAYMDIGGMVWLVGRRTFDGATGGPINFGPSGNHTIAYNYFNLSAEFSPPTTNYRQAEFAGANSLVDGFPNLVIDTVRVSYCNWALAVGGDTTYYRYSQGLIGVDYLVRLGQSETIYKYSAINPDTSGFHNFPVAIRYDRGTYKTSYFCFPLYFIQQDQAMEVTRRMLNWFFNE